jgi:hypothetical protein
VDDSQRFGDDPKCFEDHPKHFGNGPKRIGNDPQSIGNDPRTIGIGPPVVAPPAEARADRFFPDVRFPDVPRRRLNHEGAKGTKESDELSVVSG